MIVVRKTKVESKGLGERIRTSREADHRSLREISRQAGMTPANWYRIENEAQALPEETLRVIESVLGIDFGVSFDEICDSEAHAKGDRSLTEVGGAR